MIPAAPLAPLWLCRRFSTFPAADGRRSGLRVWNAEAWSQYTSRQVILTFVTVLIVLYTALGFAPGASHTQG